MDDIHSRSVKKQYITQSGTIRLSEPQVLASSSEICSQYFQFQIFLFYNSVRTLTFLCRSITPGKNAKLLVLSGNIWEEGGDVKCCKLSQSLQLKQGLSVWPTWDMSLNLKKLLYGTTNIWIQPETPKNIL